jgi:hypothetical protein
VSEVAAPHRGRRPRPLLLLVLLLAAPTAVGCVGAKASHERSGLIPIATQPDDPSRPYHITAIDYHFHDAHPTPPLDPDRTIVVTNAGRVVHNVTIAGAHYSRDIQPGDRLVIRHVGRLLGGPGVHVFFCKYHASLGMKATVVIAGA